MLNKIIYQKEDTAEERKHSSKCDVHGLFTVCNRNKILWPGNMKGKHPFTHAIICPFCKAEKIIRVTRETM